MVTMFIAEALIDGYGTNDRLTRLVDEMEWVFAPVVNVDGFIHSWSSAASRKDSSIPSPPHHNLISRDISDRFRVITQRQLAEVPADAPSQRGSPGIVLAGVRAGLRPDSLCWLRWG